MIIPVALARRFAEYRPAAGEVARIVKSTLVNFCETNGYAFLSRLKTVESLAEKIETGRFRAWSNLDDLFACTIIVPTLAHEPRVIEFCRHAFAVQTMTKRGQTRKAPEVFRFDSTRISARLHSPAGAAVDNVSPYDVLFEIQVKSAFEHAWAVSTHDLVYKSSSVDWKRLRLAAQIKATVEQLDTLILAFDSALPHISENPWPEIDQKERIAESIRQFREAGLIPVECMPKDISRFVGNLYTLLNDSEAGNNVKPALQALREELSRTPSDLIPRSVSLFQYFFAVLVSRGVVKIPLRDYVSHVTPELECLFPNLGEVGPKFEYDY